MASTYLTRTPSSTGNRRKFTFSAWVKFNFNQLANNSRIFSIGNSTSDWVSAYFNSSGTLQLDVYVGGSGSYIATNRVFRDESAWFHVVFVVDTENSTADNRLRIYVNGEEETSFSSRNNPNLNWDTQANTSGKPIDIGSSENVGYSPRYFPGIMSHVHMTDGYVYSASDFGLTDATTGEWKINTSPSVTYGTNGFFILKDGNSVTDQSGNGNNFTVGGGTLTKTEDCPSNVFATINPLDFSGSAPTLTNGNLTVASSSADRPTRATLGFSSGKWYAEYRFEASDNDNHIGCHSLENSLTNAYLGANLYSWGLVTSSGQKKNNGTSTAYGSAIGYSNSIVMIAIDKDNGKIWWGKDGTWFDNGNPANGTNPAFSNINTVVGADGLVTFADTTFRNGSWNFGNGYFGTTAVASAGTNASGNGIFEYDVPNGFTALSTKGLNL